MNIIKLTMRPIGGDIFVNLDKLVTIEPGTPSGSDLLVEGLPAPIMVSETPFDILSNLNLSTLTVRGELPAEMESKFVGRFDSTQGGEVIVLRQ